MSQPVASISPATSFQDLLTTVVHSIPKIIVFLAILLIGWIIAKALERVVDMILRRVHFDHFVERGFVGQALTRADTDATRLIGRIVYYAILLIALQMAFGVWGPNPISTLLAAIVGWLPKAIVAIIIIVVASAIARVVKDLITDTIGGLSYGPLLANIASIGIIVLGVIAALNQVGIAYTVTEPILYALLFTGAAVIAIGVGGGLVRPMQDRWERMLNAAERETTTQVTAYQQGRTDAMRGAPARTREREAQQATASAQRTGMGTGPGSGTGPGTGSAPGTGSGPGMGTGPGAGTGPGTGTGPGAGPEDYRDPGSTGR
jgi:hypothetical protein